MLTGSVVIKDLWFDRFVFILIERDNCVCGQLINALMRCYLIKNSEQSVPSTNDPYFYPGLFDASQVL